MVFVDLLISPNYFNLRSQLKFNLASPISPVQASPSSSTLQVLPPLPPTLACLITLRSPSLVESSKPLLIPPPTPPLQGSDDSRRDPYLRYEPYQELGASMALPLLLIVRFGWIEDPNETFGNGDAEEDGVELGDAVGVCAWNEKWTAREGVRPFVGSCGSVSGSGGKALDESRMGHKAKASD